MGRSDVENGTPRTRQNPGPTRTDTSRPWTSTQSSTQGTSPMIGQFFTSLKTLISRPTLTQSVFLNQKSFSTDKAALPQGGERTSSELLEITRLFSRRSTCQLLAMTSARPLSEPPGLARDSSLTTPKTVNTAPLTDGSYSETKTVDTAPLTDASYSETKTVDAAPLTDGTYSEPKTAPQIVDAGAYTEDSAADLTGAVKAPGPVY